MATPDPEHYAFVDLLFERLLFERVHARNQTTGCCINPTALEMQLNLIGYYYTAIAMSTFQRLCGEAIHNRDFSNWGILSYLSNHQKQQQQPFKIFPNSLAAKFELEIESDRSSKVCDHIFCPWMSHKQIKDFRKDYASKVSKDHQREFEFLVDMLDQNGLLKTPNCDTEPELLSRTIEKVPVAEIPIRHTENLKATHISSANGINISDYDVEIVLKAPETTNLSLDSKTSVKDKDGTNSNTSTSVTTGKKSASKLNQAKSEEGSLLTMKEIATLLTKAGYKSIQHLDRYFDPSSEINVDYLSFIDPRSDLTCQIALNHPLGIRVRDLLQDYANIDTRVEPLVFVVQKTLDDFGRCRLYLSNYAVALMTIAFLQTKTILPLLQRHLVVKSPSASSSTQSTPAATKPSHSSQSTASTSSSRRLPRSQLPSQPESAQVDQPKKNQQTTNPPAASKSQIKNQKRKDKKRMHREENLSAATEQVRTVSGGIRMVDCRYDRALAQTRPFDNKTTRETVAELLIDFMDYFGFSHRSTQCEISIISGSTTSLVKIGGSASGSQSTQGTAVKENHPCLVVRDPFVVDRNVTWLCSQWRLAHCERMFMRAIMFLEGVGVKSDEDDDEDDDESDMEDDDILEGIYAGYASDYDDEYEDGLSDNGLYPFVSTDEIVDQLASMSLFAILTSVPNRARHS
ncbi:hypothetical protein BGZ96_012699 [Linnemannia gamsii]|uniref:PAP-associated domain-containing protein n=1 Tax=Linnemannia gamsii TaxID=64522 RepID=A0ABQ7KAT0_9FUNG|nr:hypothetical protein BGZ96_012699 [Linnemannia gamsii]